MAKAKKHITLRKDHARMLEMLSRVQEVSVSELIQKYIEEPLKADYNRYYGDSNIPKANICLDVDSLSLL